MTDPDHNNLGTQSSFKTTFNEVAAAAKRIAAKLPKDDPDIRWLRYDLCGIICGLSEPNEPGPLAVERRWKDGSQMEGKLTRFMWGIGWEDARDGNVSLTRSGLIQRASDAGAAAFKQAKKAAT